MGSSPVSVSSDRPKGDIPRPLLTTRQAAQTLSICERTLFSLRERGEIRAVKLFGAVRYDPADIAAFIEKSKGGAL